MSTVPAAPYQSNTETAFAELYERHADRILGFCRRRLRSRQEAEDAVQETFVSALRALQRGTVPVCEAAWLYKIAENVCVGVYRSAARREGSDSERLAECAARGRDEETLFGLEAALSGLPPNQRRAFVLRELRGLSYREIAIQLGVSVASVETLVYRARRGIARGLESGAGLGRRLTAGLNAGSIAAAVKGWFAGATAVKVASAATAAALASLAAGEMLDQPAREAPVKTAPVAAVQQPVLWGSPRPAGPETAFGPQRPEPRRPGPRPRPASPQARATVVSKAPPAAKTAAPAPGPAVDEPRPSAPPLPAATPQSSAPAEVELPIRPTVIATPPALPELPDPAALVPAVPLPEVPELPDVPLLPEVPKLPDVPLLP